MEGSGLQGVFRSWQEGAQQRYDEEIGASATMSLRTGGKTYLVNQSGDVRELRGLLLQRQRTEDFIDDDGFVSQPQYDTFAGEKTLPDGRAVYEIAVAPPGGQPETVDLDVKTLMLDRIGYDEEDGTSTVDYYDYRHDHGVLVAWRVVESNGDRDYDVSHEVRRVFIDRPIDPKVFALPVSSVVQTDKPITVPIAEHDGHYYVTVHVGSGDYRFLIDTGAQSVVLDTHVAAEQGLTPQGHLEVAGASRTGGMGLASLPVVTIGGAAVPVRVVTVLDLRGTTGSFDADGVLGYPFFASAEVTIDPVAGTMTFAKPGTLRAAGEALPIDVDRQLAEVQGKVNGVDGRFVVDTGNSTELLLFHPFLQTHPYLVPLDRRRFARDFGVGGSAPAVFAPIDELDIGSYRLFNRNGNLMLSTQGAFADRFDAGNIGMAVLRNFIVTFDFTNAKMYLQRSAAFDDGRYRTPPPAGNDSAIP